MRPWGGDLIARPVTPTAAWVLKRNLFRDNLTGAREEERLLQRQAASLRFSRRHILTLNVRRPTASATAAAAAVS